MKEISLRSCICTGIPVVVVFSSDTYRDHRCGHITISKIFRLYTRQRRELDFENEYCNHCRCSGSIPASLPPVHDHPLVGNPDGDQGYGFVLLAAGFCDTRDLCRYRDDRPDGISCTVRDHQGVAMGLFSTTTYLGMAALPFITGLIADSSGFFYAFCVTAFFAFTVFLTIGRCDCRLTGLIKQPERKNNTFICD